MPSEKLARILRAKSTFSADEIAAMTEHDGWDWVYAHASPRKEKLPEICFTGFSPVEKEELIERARNSRLSVVTTVTKALSFLCVGENPGPVKIEKAKALNACILTRAQFDNLLETGEVPV
ncbi:MAG: BRCT domain-containing protein [Stellaceae bacterium]